MGKVFKNQTALRFSVKTEVDLTGALNLDLDYVKPSGETGHFNCSILNATAEADGDMYYDVTATGDINESGQWRFRTDVTFSDARQAYGETFILPIFDEWHY